jgi:hypothetical protein
MLALALDPSTVLTAARRQTRIFDDEAEDEERFERALHAFLNAVALTTTEPADRVRVRHLALRAVRARLRVIADQLRDPAIRDERVERPIFLTGLPRTGTTLLHRLLALDPLCRAPLLWEMLGPSPPPHAEPGPGDPRVALATREIADLYERHPDFRRIHPMDPRQAEECVWVLGHTFASWHLAHQHRIPGYATWLDGEDLTWTYQWHRRVLQQLQYGRRDKRWVLKAPAHLFCLAELLAVYPDAHVVLSHRDPVQAAASNASLTYAMRRTLSSSVQPRDAACDGIEMYAIGIERAMTVLDGLRADRWANVYYDDLVRDPIGTVESLYAALGMQLSPTARSTMDRYLAENPKDRFGSHTYDLAAFGVSAEWVRDRYAAYSERFHMTSPG